MKNKKMKNRKIWSIILMTFTLVLSVFSSFKNIVRADSIEDPKYYYKWTQNGPDTPWGKKWGKLNVYCYVTSIAIQGARNGIVKNNKGETWNPQGVSDQYGSACGYESYPGVKTKDGKTVTFKAEMAGETGDCTVTPRYGSWEDTVKKIISIEKAGKYPIVHVSSATGYNYGTHYLAVRDVKKSDGSDMTLYDPARGYGFDTIKYMGGWSAFKSNKVGFAKDIGAWSGGPIEFYGKGWGAIPASKTDQKDVGSSSNDDSSEAPKDSKGKGYGSNIPPKIKPVFNPFRQQLPDNTYIGYDTESNDKAYKRSKIINTINDIMPKILYWARILSYMLMYAFILYAILSFLIFWCDMQLGGFISNTLSNKLDSDSFLHKLFFPGDGNDFLGFDASRGWYGKAILSHLKMLFVIICVFGLISTNSLSYILGTIFYKLGQWLTF